MIYLMVIFSIIAGIDKIFNNRLGLGKKFDEGIKGIGEISLTVIGIYCLSPIISNLLTPVLGPLARLINTNPSVFIGSILAPDLGGYSASVGLTSSKIIGTFNGLILSSMLGTTISFTLPIALGFISKEDFNYFVKGVSSGIMTIPLGMLVGGIMMGISIADIFYNLYPVIIFTGLIILGLSKAKHKMVKIFKMIGNFIIRLSTIGLVGGIFNYFFSWELIPGMLSIEEGAIIVFKIGIILSGAYPMFYLISNKLNKSLSKIEDKVGLDEYSILGIFSSLANCIPMLGVYEKMNERGKILNAAFVVSGSFVFGGQLAYISSVSPSTVASFIVSKLVAGISAVFMASLLMKLEKKQRRQSVEN